MVVESNNRNNNITNMLTRSIELGCCFAITVCLFFVSTSVGRVVSTVLFCCKRELIWGTLFVGEGVIFFSGGQARNHGSEAVLKHEDNYTKKYPRSTRRKQKNHEAKTDDASGSHDYAFVFSLLLFSRHVWKGLGT